MSAEDSGLWWAGDILGEDCLEHVERLEGGYASVVWRLSARTERGPRSYVLKQLTPAAHQANPDLVAREVRVLEALAPLGLPVPELVAADPEGRTTRAPALLMTALPGGLLQGEDALRRSIPELVRAVTDWQERARALVAGRRFQPWFDAEAPKPRPATPRPEAWQRAAQIARRFPPPVADGFIHRDPHPANMLFVEERVTGVIDWPHGGRGPRGFDISRIALNLACLLDVEATRELRDRWEHATGVRHDPLLDIYALLESEDPSTDMVPAFSAQGIHVSGARLRERQEAFLVDALDRMTVRRLK